jgi:hypothetical protein
VEAKFEIYEFFGRRLERLIIVYDVYKPLVLNLTEKVLILLPNNLGRIYIQKPVPINNRGLEFVHPDPQRIFRNNSNRSVFRRRGALSSGGCGLLKEKVCSNKCDTVVLW